MHRPLYRLPHEKNADASIILRTLEVKVLSETVQLAVDKRISVQEVEKVHRPEIWLQIVNHEEPSVVDECVKPSYSSQFSSQGQSL
jgi:hypothetical protein